MDLDALLQIIFGMTATILAAAALYIAITTAKSNLHSLSQDSMVAVRMLTRVSAGHTAIQRALRPLLPVHSPLVASRSSGDLLQRTSSFVVKETFVPNSSPSLGDKTPADKQRSLRPSIGTPRPNLQSDRDVACVPDGSFEGAASSVPHQTDS